MAPEVLNAGQSRQLRHVERAGAHPQILRRKAITPVCRNRPAAVGFIPDEILDLGVKQRAVIKVVLLADTLAVLKDLRRVRVLLARHVVRFLEQRHVDKRSGVTHRAGIAIPVPRAAEVAALFDNADVRDAGFLQPCAGNEAGKSAANEGERHMVVNRLAFLKGV